MTELFMKLLNMSINAGWLVLAVLLVRIIFRKAPKWLFPLLWSFVGIRLLMPNALESRLSVIPDISGFSASEQGLLSAKGFARNCWDVFVGISNDLLPIQLRCSSTNKTGREDYGG